MTALYFAFGSNLLYGQMRRRCPSAVVEGRASIDGYRLAFAGRSTLWGGAVATLLPDRDALTEGLLYRITEADLLALDAFEGHPNFYIRRTLRVQDAHGYTRRAHVYILQGRPLGSPSAAYYGRISDAYKHLGLDRTALVQAVEDAVHA